jgi:hypothetical protein
MQPLSCQTASFVIQPARLPVARPGCRRRGGRARASRRGARGAARRGGGGGCGGGRGRDSAPARRKRPRLATACSPTQGNLTASRLHAAHLPGRRRRHTSRRTAACCRAPWGTCLGATGARRRQAGGAGASVARRRRAHARGRRLPPGEPITLPVHTGPRAATALAYGTRAFMRTCRASSEGHQGHKRGGAQQQCHLAAAAQDAERPCRRRCTRDRSRSDTAIRLVL